MTYGTSTSSSSRSQPARLRIGYFDDLTSRPLVFGLEQSVRGGNARRFPIGEIRTMLANDELDVGLLPAWDFLHAGKLNLIPGTAVSTLGAANMFLVCSKVLPTEIRRVLVDHESFGARSLAEILLPEQMSIRPEFFRSEVPLNPRTFDFQADPHDAYLLCGENSLLISRSDFIWVHDLSDAWHNFANVPFVMHVWACRRSVRLRGLEQELSSLGRQNENPPEEMVAKEAERLRVDEKGMGLIFKHALRTHCGPQEVSALRLYIRHLARKKLLPGNVQFSVYRSPEATGGYRTPFA